MKQKHLLPLSLFIAIIPFISCSDDDENEPTVPGNEQKDPNNDNESVNKIHPYVDLELPSGTLWATYNVGATKPEEYGDYFAWGETEPKEVYDWSTYKYATTLGGDLDSITKYNMRGKHGKIDSLSVLLPEDDAATVNWGNEWRLPTYEEQMELIQNCEFCWTEINGVYGAKFSAKNGKYVFFPAAGGSYSDVKYDEGEWGEYRSSYLCIGIETDTHCLYFSEYVASRGNFDRYYGFSIRAVRAK